MTDVGPGIQLELPFTKTTAFLVIVEPEGNAVATNDLTTIPTVTRKATLADMRRACNEVVADIAAAQAADTVLQRMQAAAEAQAAQQQGQQILAKLNERKLA